MRLTSRSTVRSSISLSSTGVLVVQLAVSSMVHGSDHRYSRLQHAACRATPRDALHARQEMQGPCYGGAAGGAGGDWLEVEMVLCGGRGESVAIRISVNLIIWYSVAPS